MSSDANASASAWPHVMPPSSPSASRRRSSWGTSFGWMVKPSGTVSSCSLRERSTSADTAVLIAARVAGVAQAVGERVGAELAAGGHGLVGLAHLPLGARDHLVNLLAGEQALGDQLLARRSC